MLSVIKKLRPHPYSSRQYWAEVVLWHGELLNKLDRLPGQDPSAVSLTSLPASAQVQPDVTSSANSVTHDGLNTGGERGSARGRPKNEKCVVHAYVILNVSCLFTPVLAACSQACSERPGTASSYSCRRDRARRTRRVDLRPERDQLRDCDRPRAQRLTRTVSVCALATAARQLEHLPEAPPARLAAPRRGRALSGAGGSSNERS